MNSPWAAEWVHEHWLDKTGMTWTRVYSRRNKSQPRREWHLLAAFVAPAGTVVEWASPMAPLATAHISVVRRRRWASPAPASPS